MKNKISLFIAILALLGRGVSAETLEANNISYEFDQKEDQSGRICHLNLIISNYPYRPESVQVEFSSGRPWDKHTLFSSFIVDVTDIQVKDGTPAGGTRIPIKSASFHSKHFNSPGLLYPADPGDGGMGAVTSDPDSTVELWLAVAKGDYTVEFTRQDTLKPRAYHIPTGPSVEEFSKLNACIQSLKKLR